MRTAVTSMLLLLLTTGCRDPGRGGDTERLTVFAASSLTEAFTELAQEFATKNELIPPRLAFAGSQVLRLQIEQGASADVFASADAGQMQALASKGFVTNPEAFAFNELVVIVPADNPESIRVFMDLPRARRLVVGAPEVPVGRYADELLARAEIVFGKDFADAVRSRIVSRESNTRLVRSKVELGEADAAIVYQTDVSGEVERIEIPPEVGVRASYYMALVGSEPKRIAKRWVAFVKSPRGRAIVEKHGFSTP